MNNKKIFLAIMLGMLTLSGCGVGDVGGDEKSTDQTLTINEETYEDSLDGLCTLLLDNGCISGDSKEMSAGFIHAEKGVRYQFKVNKSFVSAEVYDYGKAYDFLEGKAKETIKEARSSGKILIAGEEFPVVISSSGRYLMIYNDSSSDKENIDKAEKAKEIVKNFKG